MKTFFASLVVVAAAAGLVLSDAAFAKGKGGRSGGGRSHSGSSHHHHARSAAFVGAFGAAPLWPWWAYPVYLEAPEPVHYIERADGGEGEWLYCAGSGAYFPHVAECSGGWQSVRPPPALG